MICAANRNSAPSNRNSPATPRRETMSHTALNTGLRRVSMSPAPPRVRPLKKKKNALFSIIACLGPPLVRELDRARTLFEHFPVPDLPGACERGELKILGQFQCIYRASVFAKPAEHAARKVVGEIGQHLVFGFWVALASHHNQVLRARLGAQIARDAQRLVRLGMIVEPRRSPIALRNWRPLERVLLRDNGAWLLTPKGHQQALDQIGHQEFVNSLAHARFY